MVLRDRLVLRTRIGRADNTICAFGARKNHPRHVTDHCGLEHVKGSAKVDVIDQLRVGPTLRITDQRRKVHDGRGLACVHQPGKQRAIANVAQQKFVLAAQVRHQRVVGGMVERRHLEATREQVAYHPATVDAATTGDEYA